MLSLLFPRICPSCGKVLTKKEPPVCKDCLLALPRTEMAWHKDNSIDQLFSDDKHFVRGAAYCFYQAETPFQQCIHAFKYDRMPSIGRCIALEAAYDLIHTDFFQDIDYIVPVPLHPRKLKQRGYNQSEIISEALGEVTHIPIDTKHLIRSINTPTQTHLTPVERQKNTEKVFSLLDISFFRNRHILLVDDIITTGATIHACMHSLSSVHNVQISVFSLGKTIQKPFIPEVD